MDLPHAAAVALGLTFLWAGVAKLADRSWPAAAGAFGVSPALGRFIGPLELVLGAVLVTIDDPVPAAAALAVLVLYTAVIVVTMRSGEEAPPCACFGGFRSRPVSARTLVRNASLLLLAVVALSG